MNEIYLWLELIFLQIDLDFCFVNEDDEALSWQMTKEQTGQITYVVQWAVSAIHAEM